MKWPLKDAVREARRADHSHIWHLHVTEAQAASIGYALWLQGHALTVRSAHYFAREHDVLYEPSTAYPTRSAEGGQGVRRE